MNQMPMDNRRKLAASQKRKARKMETGDYDKTVLSGKILSLRKSMGWTFKKACEELSLSSATLSKLEADIQFNLRPYNKIKLAKYLQLSFEELDEIIEYSRKKLT
jgi:DNA-binding XRE family transcriptional regulator